jgi:hypothetical protein
MKHQIFRRIIEAKVDAYGKCSLKDIGMDDLILTGYFFKKTNQRRCGMIIITLLDGHHGV